tara:strand:- start:207 stop:536 length:330 start_codon:yes stop_codon:yes gene_type:complete
MSEQRIEEIKIQYLLGAHPNERVKLANEFAKAKSDALDAQTVSYEGHMFTFRAVERVLYPQSQAKSIEPQYIGDITELLGEEVHDAQENDGDRELPDKESTETKDRKET